MPVIGKRCHELRINDRDQTWRIIYRTDPDAVIILDVFAKKTQKTPAQVMRSCRRRLREYDRACEAGR
jgi:phage-related protein